MKDIQNRNERVILVIRLAKRNDAKRLMEINNKCWLSTYKNIFTEEALKERINESESRSKRWGEIIERDKSFYVLEIEGKIIGFVSFGETRNPMYERYGEIYSLYFDENFHGKGYGRKLIEFSISQLSKSFNNIIVVCFTKNKAMDFYKHMGFEVIENFEEEMYGVITKKSLLHLHINK